MILAFFLLVLLGVNTWFSWMLGGWIGVGSWAILIPISVLITFSGGLALGLVGLLFGKHSEKPKMQIFLRAFLRGWAWLVGCFWALPWIMLGGLSLANTIAPPTLPKITLSNGEKTIVFQSMIHIAGEKFYTDIYNDMQSLIGREYVFFYEGVQPGSEESLKKLSTLMGVEVSPTMYQTIADMTGLSIQNTQDFLGVIPSINVDLTSDEIIELAKKNTVANAHIDTAVLERLEKIFPQFNESQKKIVKILGRSMITLLIRSYTDPALQTTLYAQMPIMQIIIDSRNQHLAQTIIDSPAKNIYIHYGAMHYSGVLQLLQKDDERWKEIARTELEVMH